jgi:hypothetical protein
VIVISVVISVSMIVPLSVPPSVLDNFPSTPQTVQLAGDTFSTGRLPSASQASSGYVDYPLAIVLLSLGRGLTGLDFDALSKILGLLLSIMPAVAFFALIRDRRIGFVASLVGGLAPWIVGTVSHYTPVSLAAVIMSFLVVLVFCINERNERAIFPVLVILEVCLTISDVDLSFFFVILLVGYAGARLLLQRRTDALLARVSLLIAFGSALWVLWFILVTPSLSLLNLFSTILARVLLNPLLSSTSLAPTGVKPFWEVLLEYATFSLLLTTSFAAAYHFRRSNAHLSATILGAGFAGFVALIPWVLGFGTGIDLASRSFFIFQLGVSIAIGAFVGDLVVLKKRWSILVCSALIVLVTLNSFMYGIEPYRYDPATPYTKEDSRFNLVSWQQLFLDLGSFSGGMTIWGVRIGGAFASNLSGYNELVPGVTLSPSSITPEDLSNLSDVLGVSLVVVRHSLDTIPEWPGQPTPDADAVLSRYDIVLQTGDAYVILT